MKPIVFVITLFTIASSLSAERFRRPPIEMSVRGSLYIDYLSDGTDFGLGADITFNPARILGLRVKLTDLYFNGGTLFSLNQGFLSLFPNLDVLIYIPTRGIQPYIHTGFGLTALEGTSIVVFGGGIGADIFIAKRASFFFEPGIYVFNGSYYDYADNTQVFYRLSFGLDFGIGR
jgi:hypothetical protein